MGDLTKNFSTIEFVCRCGKCEWSKAGPVLKKLALPVAEQLQKLRDYISEKEGKDIRLISHCGIRCKPHNDFVGGVSSSRHLPRFYKAMQGAWDGHAHGIFMWKFRSYAKEAWKKGIISGGCGLYHWGIHSDKSHKRFWGRFWGKP